MGLQATRPGAALARRARERDPLWMSHLGKFPRRQGRDMPFTAPIYRGWSSAGPDLAALLFSVLNVSLSH